MMGIAAFSCKRQETSEIEKIIIDSDFIQSQIKGFYHFTCKPLKNGATCTYFLPDSTVVFVGRDSLSRLQFWRKEKDGKTVDVAEVYETTGQIRGKLNYVNGEPDGEVKYYYENGRVSTKGFYKNGHSRGEWKNYNREGKLVKVEYIDDEGNRTEKNIE
jgi:hypothetical protein